MVGLVVEELAKAASSVGSAVVGSPDAGHAVGTAVVALVVENERGELAIGTEGVASRFVGPSVVGGRVEGQASEAVFGSRAFAGLAAVGANLAGGVGGLAVEAHRASLDANAPVQEHVGPGFHVAGQALARRVVAGVAVRVADQALAAGFVGVLAIQASVEAFGGPIGQVVGGAVVLGAGLALQAGRPEALAAGAVAGLAQVELRVAIVPVGTAHDALVVEEVVDDARVVFALAAVQLAEVAERAGRMAPGAVVAAEGLLVLAGGAVRHARVQHDLLVVHRGGVVRVGPAGVALVVGGAEAAQASGRALPAKPGDRIGVVPGGAARHAAVGLVEEVEPAAAPVRLDAIIEGRFAGLALRSAQLAQKPNAGFDELAFRASQGADALIDHFIVRVVSC